MRRRYPCLDKSEPEKILTIPPNAIGVGTMQLDGATALEFDRRWALGIAGNSTLRGCVYSTSAISSESMYRLSEIFNFAILLRKRGGQFPFWAPKNVVGLGPKQGNRSRPRISGLADSLLANRSWQKDNWILIPTGDRQ